MTRAERYANMAGVIVPFLGLIAAIVFLWHELGRLDRPRHPRRAVHHLRAGDHGRLPPAADPSRVQDATSRSSTASRSLGSMALQGGVLDWVADHRKHHAHTDQEGDPHSPHVGHGEGLKGLWHAHTGWLFETHGQADWKKYAKELYEDPVMKKINRLFPLWAFLSLAVPTAARLGAARLHGRGRAARPGLGRPRPRVLPAPHHVVDQLRLPLLRPAPLRRRGPLHERRLARASPRSASRGTTTTTRSRARPRTA